MPNSLITVREHTLKSKGGKLLILKLPANTTIDDVRASLNLNDSYPVPVLLKSREIDALDVYLRTGKVQRLKRLERALEYLQIGTRCRDVPKEWLIIKREEDWYRANASSMKLDPFHGLVPVTPAVLKELEQIWTQPKEISSNKLFWMSPEPRKICQQPFVLNWMKAESKSLMLAGGCVVMSLLDEAITKENPYDWDYFLVGADREKALRLIERMFGPGAARSRYAITQKEQQLILRLYESPAQVLHGFDVDSCKVGFFNGTIWMTRSCLWAWKNRTNVVDFNRRSPSYEYRLAKYSSRGFDVWIPEFDISKVNLYKLSTIDRVGLKGLDKLLVLCLTASKAKEKCDTDYDHTEARRRCAVNRARNGFPHYFTGTKTEITAVVVGGCRDTVDALTVQKDSDLKGRKLMIPHEIEFITIDPGQQSTGTFNPIDGGSAGWYDSRVYDC